MKVQNSLNYKRHKGQTFTQPSLTVPDQTMSLKEILSRHARGLPISGKTSPVYDETEEYLPDPTKMDLADRQQYAKQLKEELAELNDKRRRTKDNDDKKDNSAND